MAEKKRPRRTRERILATSLELFNRFGASHVTTANIADEMNISPGNLYYHFGSKDEIVGELYTAFETRMTPLFADPRNRRVDVDDLWLWLHVLFEAIRDYRFLFRDLDAMSERDRIRTARFGALLRKGVATVIEWSRGLVAAGAMRATERELATLGENVMLVASFWASYERIRRPGNDADATPDAGRAAHQVLALFGPHLAPDGRAHLEQLAASYL